MPSEIAALLATFDTAYQARLGLRYPFVGGKEAKLMQGLLKLYSVPQIEAFIAAFFESEDDFIVQTGHSFGAFHSCLPKLIAAIQQARPRERQCWHDHTPACTSSAVCNEKWMAELRAQRESERTLRAV